MRKLLLPAVISILFFGFLPDGHKDKRHATPAITANEIQFHINYLASDELKGRLNGSEGAEAAASYIEKEFESYGLAPFFSGRFSQEFPFIAGVELTGDNSLSLKINNSEKPLKLNEEYITAPFSDNVSYSGDVVFAGYSISAPELNYDDYAGIDVKGKIVLALKYNPEIDNPHSKFEKYSELRLKAKTARDKGALGIIFVNGYLPKDEEDKLMQIRYDGAPAVKDFAAIQIKRSSADEIFRAEGLDFKQYQLGINDSLRPASFILKNTTLSLRTGLRKIEKQGRNIAGILPGRDPVLKNEYIVVGAHYDHLGMGENGSLYKGSEPMIHNGADDNASGVAGLLELAEKFSSVKDGLKRSIVFVAFAGEELGVIGSTYFVNHFPDSLKSITSMLNMDMIGRMNSENNLVVNGSGTSSIWNDLLTKTNSRYNFKLSLSDDGYLGSDQSSFVAKDIPVLFFFTGIHNDYHRPSDDADKINSLMEGKIVNYVYDVASYLDSAQKHPDYVKVARKDAGRNMKFKVYVGTIPDYTSQADGFKITGVSEGSPAQKGGLKAGDIIVEFGGKKVGNIYDYMYAMGEFAPGDVVDVVVVRGSEKVKLKLELRAR